MKNRYILTSLFTLLAIGLQAQGIPTIPKLVVGVTIDQLRADYLDAFSALYGNRGFKRLMKEGRVYQNAEYDYVNVDQASAIASIFSGTTPYTHGITGNTWMDRNTLRMISCVDDVHYMGVYSNESTSAVNLKVSNLADELIVATQGKGHAYAIAPTREMAVLAAGHAGKGAFWINDETGKWSGSTYYGSFPNWASSLNDHQGLNIRIDNLVWTPSLPLTMYNYVTTDIKEATFKHAFSAEKSMKYRRLKTSPMVNDEVNKLVNACLSGAPMGYDEIPDLLSVVYYAGNYNHQPATELPLEIQDTYARLDNSIADLLDILDKRVGLQNVLLFVTSTGNTDPESADPNEYRIPSGEFHMNRCAALLNMYLVALYGEGQYVETYGDQEIFLNHKLIEKKELSLTDIMNRSAEFLVQFSGVKDAYTSQRLQLGSWTPELDKIKNHYNAVTSGDIWIEVLPGWTVVNDLSGTKQVVRHAYTSVPLIWMGWNVKPEIIDTPVKVGHIAPTVSHALRIRAPNAAMQAPLTGLRK